MTFSLPLALALWLALCVGMNFVFKGNRRLVGYIAYYEKVYEAAREKPLGDLPRLDCFVSPTRVSLWFKELRHLRKDALCKLNSEVPLDSWKYKRKILPFSVFASGTIGVGMAWIAYGNLILNSTATWMILLEAHAFFAVLLFLFYWLFFAVMVIDALIKFGTAIAPPKQLFNIGVAIIAVLIYFFVVSSLRSAML